MVFTRSSIKPRRVMLPSTPLPTSSSDDVDGLSTTSFVSSVSTLVSSTTSVQSESQAYSKGGSSSSGTRTDAIMTRKRRLVQQTEADLAIGFIPYWEGVASPVEEDHPQHGGERDSRRSGHQRRSRRGEARRRYEDAAGVSRVHEKMAVNLPPMLSTREGKLLAVEVFGDGVRKRLPAVDKGPRVGHCSSGYVCGHPVPRGKEGNSWCQTPVKASLNTGMACMHHQHRRVGNGGPTSDQRRHLLLAGQFYDQKGELSWLRVVSYLRSFSPPFEEGQRKQVITTENRAFALTDVKIVLHGFRQCNMFWLAACRLTRRGYAFTMVAHASKTKFRDFLTRLRNDKSIFPLPKQASSPFVCITDLNFNGGCYYANGYDEVCRVF